MVHVVPESRLGLVREYSMADKQDKGNNKGGRNVSSRGVGEGKNEQKNQQSDKNKGKH